MFVTDIGRWEEVGRAHGEVFREIRPAATMVEVKALVHPAMLVEIEVDAVVAGSTSDRKGRGTRRPGSPARTGGKADTKRTGR